ncbi:hypothetical protein PRK78_001364 [Emydomyces testavorans]|uniref:Uncharacterized protein n=1 Tax=Emydomyces testavorans TaxID=2070801 RepID=A0AAF0DCE1_9EURO|nr:hypothetical protein PRK78_001364 [Emydomyces testavorans]
MTLEEREEREVQKAMAASLNCDFDADGQETGVVSTAGTKFGPANRDYYDTTLWAMTPYNDTTIKEVCINPDPEERKRDEDLPSFLRPSKNVNYLAACITILHAIPLSREAFIARNMLVADYGYHPHWWDGTRIYAPGPTSMEDENSGIRKTDDVVLEAQRLMAFLDGTYRAFGSADALANLLSARRDSPSKFLPVFLEKWQREVLSLNQGEYSGNIFESIIVKKSTFSSAEPIRVPFYVADLSFEPDTVDTLYDVIDTNLWPDSPETGFQETWIEHVAPVFIMRLTARSATSVPLGVKIPPVWYPDRYLESNKAFAQQLRAHRLEVEAELERLEMLIYKYSTAELPSGQKASFSAILKNAIIGTDIAIKGRCFDNSPNNGDRLQESILTIKRTEKLASDLKTIAEKVDQKLSTLYQKRQQVRDRLKQSSKGLTVKDGNGPPYYKYMLRGVCTHEHVMYVLKRIPGVESMRETFPDMTFENEWQWWRISYSVDDAKESVSRRIRQPVMSSRTDGTKYILDPTRPRVPLPNHMEVTGYTITPVREIEVLRAAKEESSSALLVYANEDSVHLKDSVLPEPLQAFVDADNDTFEHEIWNLKMKLEKTERGEEEGKEEEFVEDVEEGNDSGDPQFEPCDDDGTPLTESRDEVADPSTRHSTLSGEASALTLACEESHGAIKKDVDRMDIDTERGVPPAA